MPVTNAKALPEASIAWQSLAEGPDPSALTEAEQQDYQTLRSELRRREWWAGRMAARAALSACGAPTLSLRISAEGPPRLEGPGAEAYSVAVTHGRRQAAAIATRRAGVHPFVGIDLLDAEDEARIARIQSRVLQPEEQLLCARDPRAALWAWGAREAIAKATQTGMFVFALSKAWLVELDPLTVNLPGILVFAEPLPEGGLVVIAGATPAARDHARRSAGLSP